MALVKEYYNWIVNDLSDQRVHSYPFVAEPWGVLTIAALYLYGVYIFFPSYMADRKPYSLKTIIQAYNIYQVIACTALIYGVATSGWTTHITLGCHEIDYSSNPLAVRMANCMWWHMMLKMTELLETVFFCLRKKYSQVSTLHVYHHTVGFLTSWVACKYFAGGMLTFTPIINSFIHILMYSYYYFASLGPEWQKRLQFIKSKLTLLQLIQLALIFLHTSQIFLPSCQVPVAPALIHMPNIGVNIYLFIKFYLKSYSKKTKAI